MELSFKRLLKWIELCGLRLEHAHTSGHMYQKDIERIPSEINSGVRIGTAEIYNEVEQLPEVTDSLAIGQN